MQDDGENENNSSEPKFSSGSAVREIYNLKLMSVCMLSCILVFCSPCNFKSFARYCFIAQTNFFYGLVNRK